MLTSEASSAGEGQGMTQMLLTLNQKNSLAGISQSKVMIEHREQSQISDRIIAMNKKRVAGQRLLINEHKFLILSNLPSNDTQCLLYMQELRIMNQALAVAIEMLTSSEQDIILDQAMFDSESRKSKAAEFVDLTIAAALDFSSSAASDLKDCRLYNLVILQ